MAIVILCAEVAAFVIAVKQFNPLPVTATIVGIALLMPAVRALLVPIAGSKVSTLFPKDSEGGLFGSSFRTILADIDSTFRRYVVNVSSVKKDSFEGSAHAIPACPGLN